MFFTSAFSGKVKSGIFVDVASSQIISQHSVEESTPSLASDAFFFANVVAGIRGVGGARLRGELRFHANILGTAPVLRLIFPLRLLCRSFSPKCLEQSWVPLFREKLGPTSLLIADGFYARRKAEYISALEELIKTCGCCSI